MTPQQIKKADDKYVAATYAKFPLHITDGEGSICTGADAKTYIDFTSGIGVNSLGFSDAGWAKTVSEQAKMLNHTSNLYTTEPQAQLARKLCKMTGYKNLFFSNSGAEANECAIKTARKYSFDKYGKGRHEIITLTNSFHGRTMTTLTATGQPAMHNFFFPFAEGFSYVQTGDMSLIEQATSDKTCAVMLEFVQGEGGVIAQDESFITELFEFCKQRDILVIADEVQTGIGRTGRLLASEHYGVKPDIVSLAKGLGGGLPIGATLFGSTVQDVLTPGTHGSTFGGNPICCAGANYVLSKMDDDFLRNVRKMGKNARRRMQSVEGINDISGLGLMIGLDINPIPAKDVLDGCLAKGLLVLTAKDKIRLLPPLNIGHELLMDGLDILDKVIASHKKGG